MALPIHNYLQILYQILTFTQNSKQSRLTQRDLAAMCGLPQSSVARIESCKTTPNLKTLLNIFEHLGLSLTVTPSKRII